MPDEDDILLDFTDLDASTIQEERDRRERDGYTFTPDYRFLSTTVDELSPHTNPRYESFQIGNGRMFVDFFRSIILMNDTRGRWYIYDGRVWRPDQHDIKIAEMAKDFRDTLLAFVPRITSEDTRKRFLERVQKLDQRKYRDLMVKDAASDPAVTVDMSAFDRDKFLFNCHNGTINLLTGEFKAHDPADMCTVRLMLQNERYCGDILLQKTICESHITHKQIKNDTTEVPSYYIENHHQAIISRKQFNRCKQIFALRRTPHPDMPGKYNNQYPLGDKLVCPICGSRLFKRSIKIQRPGSGWSCEIGEHACRQFIIRASFVDQALLNAYHTLDAGIVEKKLDSPKFGSEAEIMLRYKREYPRMKKVDYWWVDDLVDHIEFGKHIRTTKELIALEVKGTPDPDDRSMKVFWKCGLVTTVPSDVFYDSDLPGRIAKRYYSQQKRNAEKNNTNKGKGRDKK